MKFIRHSHSSESTFQLGRDDVGSGRRGCGIPILSSSGENAVIDPRVFIGPLGESETDT
jgi:hypothetical protein